MGEHGVRNERFNTNRGGQSSPLPENFEIKPDPRRREVVLGKTEETEPERGPQDPRHRKTKKPEVVSTQVKTKKKSRKRQSV